MNAHPQLVDDQPLERSAELARRLFDQAGRDYESRRQARQRAESAYQGARARLVDGFRVELADLQHRAREAVRRLDAEHAERMTHEDRMIAALDQLRQG
jgi:hypothetical protein